MKTKETLVAGYTFVRCVRALSYAILAGIILFVLGMSGTAAYKAAEDFCRIRKEYHAAEERIALLRSDHEKLKNETIAQERAFVEEHQHRVSGLSEAVNSALEAFNRSAESAVNEIRKVSPHSADYNFPRLELPDMTTEEQCRKGIALVESEALSVDKLKEELYRSITDGLQALRKPISEKLAELTEKIQEQEELIARLEEEIKRIENSYKAEQKVITITEIRDEHLNISPVYAPEQEADKLCMLGELLPFVAGNINERKLLKESDVADFRSAVARLTGWLPVYRPKSELREEKQEIIPDPNPTLSADDRNRITSLNERIDAAKKEIERLRRESEPFEAELKDLETSGHVLNESKQFVLNNWEVTAKLSALNNASSELLGEVIGYPEALQELQDELAGKLQNSEQFISTAVSEKELNWSSSCKQISGDLFDTVIRQGEILLGGWLTWALLLVIMDFMVSILVTALRLQDAQRILEEGK